MWSETFLSMPPFCSMESLFLRARRLQAVDLRRLQQCPFPLLSRVGQEGCKSALKRHTFPVEMLGFDLPMFCLLAICCTVELWLFPLAMGNLKMAPPSTIPNPGTFHCEATTLPLGDILRHHSHRAFASSPIHHSAAPAENAEALTSVKGKWKVATEGPLDFPLTSNLPAFFSSPVSNLFPL